MQERRFAVSFKALRSLAYNQCDQYARPYRKPRISELAFPLNVIEMQIKVLVAVGIMRRARVLVQQQSDNVHRCTDIGCGLLLIQAEQIMRACQAHEDERRYDEECNFPIRASHGVLGTVSAFEDRYNQPLIKARASYDVVWSHEPVACLPIKLKFCAGR